MDGEGEAAAGDEGVSRCGASMKAVARLAIMLTFTAAGPHQGGPTCDVNGMPAAVLHKIAYDLDRRLKAARN